MQVLVSEGPFPHVIDDMPLNETDRAWVRQEIQHAYERHGIGKLIGFIKDWSAVGAAAAILIIIFTQWSGYIEFRTKTQDRLKTIEANFQSLPDRIGAVERNLQRLTGIIEGMKLNQLSTSPSDPQSGAEVKKLLDDAKSKKINIDTATIANSGTKFLEATKSNRSAWDVVLAFLSYRSYLNADFAPSASNPIPSQQTNFVPEVHVKPLIPPLPAQPSPGQGTTLVARIFLAGAYTAPENSARLEGLKHPNSTSSGRALILITEFGHEDAIVPDDMYMKNVIVSNAIVEYDGGSVVLENVYFVNCTFIVRLTAPARQLGQNLLASASVTFQNREG